MGKAINSSAITGTNINGIPVSYKACASTNYTSRSNRQVSYVVMHYTGNTKDTALANANYFASTKIAASAHFFVDETSIYQSVKLKDRAWHCGTSGTYYSNCRNDSSFGIEMCCSGNYRISETTKENAAHLCAYLCSLIGITANSVDTYVLRHYDVTHKDCPAQMAGFGNSEWAEFKSRVKEILNGSDTKSVTSNSDTSNINWTSPKSFAGGYSKGKVYKTKCDLNIRKGAGTDQTIIKALSKGTRVVWYGYYTKRNSTTWLWVQCGSITGFVSQGYLVAT